MAIINLLYKKEYPINDKIHVRIPTVGEVIDAEEDYYNMVSMLTSMPIDMMVELDKIGIDFTEIDEYQLFLLLFSSVKQMDTTLIFGDLDLTKFEMMVREDNGTIVLVDQENDIVIDRAIAAQIALILRKLHHFEKDNRKPANKDAKDYMLERAKAKAKRNKNRTRKSQLEPLIIAMVNTEQYHYGFEETKNLTIYQFNESVRQVIKKVQYSNTMHGVYSGTVSIKDLSQDDMNWLIHK